MLFGLFTLFVALVISAVAAYYSIVGLTAIFSAAVIPIIIMGAALEVGKVTAAVWLKLNWHKAKWTYKLYLVPAVIFLMLLTSMGIFGFLSKAHSDQNLVSGDVIAKIAIYDEKIRIAKENIDANRRALKQMDEAVDQVMGRSTTETGAERSVQIRRQQGPERQRLIREIEAEQKKISTLNEERAPIAAEVRKVEAEVGPIKYIAALVYGDNPDTNLLERAVRWVIILIVAVFDPLALVLILAAQQSIRWAKEDKEQQQYPTIADLDRDVGEPPTEEEKMSEEEFRREMENDPELKEFFDRARTTAQALDRGEPIPGAVEVKLQDEQGDVSAETTNEVSSNPPAPPADVAEHHLDTHPYLRQGFAYPPGWMFQPPMVAKSETEETSLVDQAPTVPTVPTVPRYVILEGGYVEIDGKTMHQSVVKDLYPEVQADIDKRVQELGLKATADNLPLGARPSKATFGIEMPRSPEKGEMFLNVATLPSKLFKFNGDRWIEVDKTITDSYTFNDDYLRFLIEKINRGHVNPEELSDKEQEQITEYLKKNV